MINSLVYAAQAMYKAIMKVFVHITVIIAMITLGISPACAFINGSKNWIEICSADGLVKRVQVQADQTLMSDEPTTDHHESAADDCGFCFAFAHGKLLKADSALLHTPLFSAYKRAAAGTWLPLNYQAASFKARAPPTFS